jgi:tetratricopeptide (TPR) repeat protein
MRRTGLILLLLILLGGGLWLAGPHLAAWYHFRAGRSALERYHSQDALDHLNACLEVWPDSAQAHLLAARAARRTGADDKAKEHLEECQRLEANLSNESLLEQDLLEASKGYLDGVEAKLEDQAEKTPDQAPLIWEALAEGYLRMYRIRDALLCLDTWLRHDPENTQAHFLRGNAWRTVLKLSRAAPHYRQVVQRDPERVDARKWLAFCLVELGQYNEALPHLESLRRQEPGDLEILVRLARCRSKMRQPEAARTILSELLAEHPDNGHALRTMGQLAVMEDKPAEAEKWFRRAVQHLPNDYQLHFQLQQVLERQGKKGAANAEKKTVEILRKRMQRLGEIQSHDMTMRPRDPALHCEMGDLLLQVGHREVGLRWLESALRLDPDYSPAHMALARYYASRGDTEQAAMHRRKAEDKVPK